MWVMLPQQWVSPFSSLVTELSSHVLHSSVCFSLTNIASPYAFVYHERDTPDWSHAHLRNNTGPLHSPPNSDCTCYQLRYADGLPFHHRIRWLPNHRNGWRIRRRYLQCEEASIWNNPVGCICRIRTKSRSTSRKFLFAYQGLALDNVGEHVVGIWDFHRALLLLPRDRGEHHPPASRQPSP